MPDNEMTGDLFLFAGSKTSTGVAPRLVSPAAILVERIREGDEDAFGEFYKMFAPMVHGILLARVPRAHSRIPNSYRMHRGIIISIMLTGSEGVRTMETKAIIRIAWRRFSRYSLMLTSEIRSRNSITSGS